MYNFIKLVPLLLCWWELYVGTGDAKIIICLGQNHSEFAGTTYLPYPAHPRHGQIFQICGLHVTGVCMCQVPCSALICIASSPLWLSTTHPGCCCIRGTSGTTHIPIAPPSNWSYAAILHMLVQEPICWLHGILSFVFELNAPEVH